jgi:hypothetical protein
MGMTCCMCAGVDVRQDAMHEQVRGLEGGTRGGTHVRVRGMTRPGAGGGRRSLRKGVAVSGVGSRAAHEHGACGSN